MAISVGRGPGRHRAGVRDVRGEAGHGRFARAAASAASTRWSTTSTSWMRSTTRRWCSPMVGGSRVVLWKGVDAGLIDGIVNGVGRARARRRRRAAAAAIGQHPQLRHLGGVRARCW